MKNANLHFMTAQPPKSGRKNRFRRLLYFPMSRALFICALVLLMTATSKKAVANIAEKSK